MSALADDFTASDLEDVGVVKCALRAIGTAFSRLAPEEQHGQSVGLRAAATFVAKMASESRLRFSFRCTRKI